MLNTPGSVREVREEQPGEFTELEYFLLWDEIHGEPESALWIPHIDPGR